MATQHGVQILPERNTLIQAIHMREVHASTPNALKCIGTTQGKISTTCHDNRLAIDGLPATKITRIPPPHPEKKPDAMIIRRRSRRKKKIPGLFLFSTPGPDPIIRLEISKPIGAHPHEDAHQQRGRAHVGIADISWHARTPRPGGIPGVGLSERGLRKHGRRKLRKAAAGQALHAHGRIQKVDWLHAHQNYNEPILVSMAAFQLRTLSTGRPRSRRIWHWRASCSNTFVGTLAHAMLTTCLRSFGGSIWPSVPLSMRTPKLLGEPFLSLYVRMANRNCPVGISHVQWSTWVPCP